MDPEKKRLPQVDEEPPPLFRTWRAWYLLLLGNLILMIVLFYLFTRYFS